MERIKATPKSAEELSDVLRCSYCKDELANSADAEVCERTDQPEILHSECAAELGVPTRKLGITYAQYLKFDQYSSGLTELCEGNQELRTKLSEKFGLQQPETKAVEKQQNLETVVVQETPVDENLALDEKVLLYPLKAVKATVFLAGISFVLPWLIADKAYQAKLIKHPVYVSRVTSVTSFLVAGVMLGYNLTDGNIDEGSMIFCIAGGLAAIFVSEVISFGLYNYLFNRKEGENGTFEDAG